MTDYVVYNENAMEFPVVVNVPHSGTNIPDEVKKRLKPNVLLPNMDWLLRELFDFLPKKKVTLLENNISRYVVDVNRRPQDIDNGMYQNTVVYQATTWNRPMYDVPLSQVEIDKRLQDYYYPYHGMLTELIEKKLQKFQTVYLFDLHSFAGYRNSPVKEDLIISNNFGNTCDAHDLSMVTSVFEQQGFQTAQNVPFSGGHIINHYSKTYGNRLKAVQLELKYNCYIADRYFGEEEVSERDSLLFDEAKSSLQKCWDTLLHQIQRDQRI